MTPSIRILLLRVNDPEELDAIPFYAREEESITHQDFPARSGRKLDTFLMMATKSDFAVYRSEMDEDDHGLAFVTCMIAINDVPRVLPRLADLVETNAEQTALALRAYGGDQASLAGIQTALATGEWPTSGDPGEETAAFAHQLLKLGRLAIQLKFGLCWEFHGDFAA